jgi:hypothetical protein
MRRQRHAATAAWRGARDDGFRIARSCGHSRSSRPPPSGGAIAGRREHQRRHPPAAQPPQPAEDVVTVGYASVYYPGTTVAATASTVSLAAGEERTGVDFPLRLVRTARIEGQVVTPPGIRPQTVQLMMSPTSSGGSGASLELMTMNRVAPGPDGRFSFTAVPPGNYTSRRARRPGAGRHAGAAASSCLHRLRHPAR